MWEEAEMRDREEGGGREYVKKRVRMGWRSGREGNRDEAERGMMREVKFISRPVCVYICLRFLGSGQSTNNKEQHPTRLINPNSLLHRDSKPTSELRCGDRNTRVLMFLIALVGPSLKNHSLEKKKERFAKMSMTHARTLHTTH